MNGSNRAASGPGRLKLWSWEIALGKSRATPFATARGLAVFLSH